MDKFGNDFQVSGSRGGARGRAAFRGGGRGDFRGGRGGGAPRGKSYHEGGRFPDRSSGYGDYQGKRDQRGGGARGGGAYRGGAQRGAYRGRSEPPRGGGANNRGYKGLYSYAMIKITHYKKEACVSIKWHPITTPDRIRDRTGAIIRMNPNGERRKNGRVRKEINQPDSNSHNDHALTVRDGTSRNH